MEKITQKIIASNKSLFGKYFDLKNFLNEISKKKVVFFGEEHSNDKNIKLQMEIQKILISEDKKTKLNIIFEHFSFDMQPILDQFLQGEISFEEMLKQYDSIGTEAHHIKCYKMLFDHARENKNQISLFAGFIPRTFAKIVMREGEENALNISKEKDYIPQEVNSLEGTEFHYNLFESMLSGRNYHDKNLKPSDKFQKIFKAQLIKDYAMAYRINKLLLNDSEEQKYLVLAGRGHLQHACGVPERVIEKYPNIAEQSTLITALEANHLLRLDLEAGEMDEAIEDVFGIEANKDNKILSEFVFIYQNEDSPENVKSSTASAYDKVGESALLEGNLKKAKKIMKFLGYTDEEFKIAGKDAYNYQGVGNPHLFAKIKPGETVLDLGSGLGVDSFIASNYTGEKGRVIGLDISKMEVKHAENRAKEREAKVEFMVGDMEKMPFDDNLIDVVISNGAFCLTPSKENAFREIYRVLKPGGRMSVCTSIVKHNLKPGVNWPLCMRMFIHIDQIVPLCQEIGFENVRYDDSNSLMIYELPKEEGEEEEKEDEKKQNRNKVHVGSREFEHLKDYDMNTICGRVTVIATKPL